MQILKNLFQLSGSLNGVTWRGGYGNYEDANVYLLRTAEGCVLFDCGCGETWEQIVANMNYWGISLDEVKACFLTHSHMDHTGAGHFLAERNIPIYAHSRTAAALEAADERCGGYLYHKEQFSFRVGNTFNEAVSFESCGVEICAEPFPGHTMGCTAYIFTHEGKKIVVSGDIIGTLLDGYFGWDGSVDFDYGVYLESLKRFARVESDIMLPGHGMVYFGRPKVRVEDALCVALSEWRK